MKAEMEIVMLNSDVITASGCTDPSTPKMLGGDGSDCGTGDAN